MNDEVRLMNPQSGLRDVSFIVHHSSFPILVLIVSGGHTEVGADGGSRPLSAAGRHAGRRGWRFPQGRVAAGSTPAGRWYSGPRRGDPARFPLPRALMTQPDAGRRYNFSFSGLKDGGAAVGARTAGGVGEGERE